MHRLPRRDLGGAAPAQGARGMPRARLRPVVTPSGEIRTGSAEAWLVPEVGIMADAALAPVLELEQDP
eukprot:4798752-Pyramimonas_sp.AAC.1